MHLGSGSFISSTNKVFATILARYQCRIQSRSDLIFGPFRTQTPARNFSLREADLAGICAHAEMMLESRKRSESCRCLHACLAYVEKVSPFGSDPSFRRLIRTSPIGYSYNGHGCGMRYEPVEGRLCSIWKPWITSYSLRFLELLRTIWRTIDHQEFAPAYCTTSHDIEN
jgi:hypothetical protein